MRNTKIGLIIVMLFASFALVFTVLRTNKNISFITSRASGSWNGQCVGSPTSNAPCVSCTFSDIKDGVIQLRCKTTLAEPLNVCPDKEPKGVKFAMYKCAYANNKSCDTKTFDYVPTNFDGATNGTTPLGVMSCPTDGNGEVFTAVLPELDCGRIETVVSADEMGGYSQKHVYTAHTDCLLEDQDIAQVIVPTPATPGTVGIPGSTNVAAGVPGTVTASGERVVVVVITPVVVTATTVPSPTIAPTKTPTPTKIQPTPTKTPPTPTASTDGGESLFTAMRKTSASATSQSSGGFRCDARCGVCGVADAGGVCQDTTNLPDGTACCHLECVNDSCAKVSGAGVDSCTTTAQCLGDDASTPAQIITQKPASSSASSSARMLPQTGVLPWFILIIPLAIILVGLAM